MAHLERFVAFSMLNEESSKSMQRIKSAYMGALGLQSSDAILLAILSRHEDGLTAAELARACSIDRAVVSRALPRLLSSGVILCSEPPSQKRGYRSRLILTEKGQSTVEKMNGFAVETVRRTSCDISTEDIATFYRVFRKLEKRLADCAQALENEERKKP